MIRKNINVKLFASLDPVDEGRHDAYDTKMVQVRISEKMHTGVAGYVLDLTVAEANELCGKLQKMLHRVASGQPTPKYKGLGDSTGDAMIAPVRSGDPIEPLVRS